VHVTHISRVSMSAFGRKRSAQNFIRLSMLALPPQDHGSWRVVGLLIASDEAAATDGCHRDPCAGSHRDAGGSAQALDCAVAHRGHARGETSTVARWARRRRESSMDLLIWRTWGCWITEPVQSRPWKRGSKVLPCTPSGTLAQVRSGRAWCVQHLPPRLRPAIGLGNSPANLPRILGLGRSRAGRWWPSGTRCQAGHVRAHEVRASNASIASSNHLAV